MRVVVELYEGKLVIIGIASANSFARSVLKKKLSVSRSMQSGKPNGVRFNGLHLVLLTYDRRQSDQLSGTSLSRFFKSMSIK